MKKEKTKESSGVDEQNSNDTVGLCNKNSEDVNIKLVDLYQGHSTIITRNCQFFGYGILIALFHYGKSFFIEHPVIASSSALLSVITLLLLYIYSAHNFISSNSILLMDKAIKETNRTSPDFNDAWKLALYEKLRKRSWILFLLIQVSLIISVVLFLISSAFYFYR